jgi:hypothetical protein
MMHSCAGSKASARLRSIGSSFGDGGIPDAKPDRQGVVLSRFGLDRVLAGLVEDAAAQFAVGCPDGQDGGAIIPAGGSERPPGPVTSYT